MATVKTKFRKSSVRDSEYYKPGGYISYARYVIERLMAAGKPVAVKYASSLRSFIRFNGDVEVSFSRFDANLMSAYETWLRESGKSRNTTSYYLRNLQAIYTRAADDGLVGHGANPFRRVYTGVDLTVKRALPISVIRRIRDADLTLYPQIAYARDMFMFSFCTRGMSFVDMAYLRPCNLQDDMLSYRRKKTGRLVVVKWNREMEEIVSRYASRSTNYLLPIVTAEDTRLAHRQYITATQCINRRLQRLARMLGISTNLTMYVARHSWATAAKASDIPVSTISRCMGHESEKTTYIYLSTIDTSDVDRATDVVIRSLYEKKNNG